MRQQPLPCQCHPAPGGQLQIPAAATALRIDAPQLRQPGLHRKELRRPRQPQPAVGAGVHETAQQRQHPRRGRHPGQQRRVDCAQALAVGVGCTGVGRGQRAPQLPGAGRAPAVLAPAHPALGRRAAARMAPATSVQCQQQRCGGAFHAGVLAPAVQCNGRLLPAPATLPVALHAQQAQQRQSVDVAQQHVHPRHRVAQRLLLLARAGHVPVVALRLGPGHQRYDHLHGAAIGALLHHADALAQQYEQGIAAGLRSPPQ
ncbi:hypothetical protein D3C71_1025960 [compost metagenome]